MFDTILVKRVKDADPLGRALWAPMLPSYQFDSVTWAEGQTEKVARVDFPADAPIEITVQGEIAPADVPALVALGWRIRPRA